MLPDEGQRDASAEELPEIQRLHLLRVQARINLFNS